MRVLVTGLLLLTMAGSVAAQNKTKPPVKPAPGKPYVLGTKQLPGDFGKFGQEYTLGVQNPLNVTLKSAAYLVDRVSLETVGDGRVTRFPPAGKKYIRFDLTVKNPDPKQRDAELNAGSLKFTVVDADNENHEWQSVFNPKTGKELNTVLKPAQSMDVFVVIELPAEGEAPKLILQREEGAAVLRYDLKGKIKPLPTWAGTGANAKDVIAGIRDCVHPTQHFDVGVRGLEWTKAALDGDPAGEDERLLIAHLTFRAATGGQGLSFGSFQMTVKTAGGEAIERETPGGVGGFLVGTGTQPYNGTPDKGEVVNIRVHFRLKENAVPKTLSIKDDQASGRTITFDISDTDWFTIRDCVRDIRTGQKF